MNANSRQLSIIKILLGTCECVSSIALSQEIRCSTKTIQGEIKDINYKLNTTKLNLLKKREGIVMKNGYMYIALTTISI